MDRRHYLIDFDLPQFVHEKADQIAFVSINQQGEHQQLSAASCDVENRTANESGLKEDVLQEGKRL